MAQTFVVVLHKGMGVVGGAFTTHALAATFVGAAPNCGYEIKEVTIDGAVGEVVPQGGSGNSAENAQDFLDNRGEPA